MVRQHPSLEIDAYRFDPEEHGFRVTFVKANSEHQAVEYCLANFKGGIKEVTYLPPEASVERFIDLSSQEAAQHEQVASEHPIHPCPCCQQSCCCETDDPAIWCIHCVADGNLFNENAASEIDESIEERVCLVCPDCGNDGWVAIPRWADAECRKVRILKVRCRCGRSPDPQEPGVLTREQLEALDAKPGASPSSATATPDAP